MRRNLILLFCQVLFLEWLSFVSRHEKTSAEFVTRLPPGKHSTKGIGRTMPDPQGYRTTDSGAVIPMGKSIAAKVEKTSLLYNEYPLHVLLHVVFPAHFIKSYFGKAFNANYLSKCKCDNKLSDEVRGEL